MEVLTLTENVVPEDKDELGGSEYNQLTNKPTMPNSIESFNNVYEYDISSFSLREALVNELSHFPKLVLSRVFGPKPKLLKNNNRIGGDELFQAVRK